MQRSTEDVPVNRLLGIRLDQRSAQSATMSMDARADFEQEHGVVHGGLLATLADTAAVYCFHPDLEPGQGLTSIEFKVNFLRPVLPGGERVVARAQVVKRGRRIGLCDVEVEQGERQVLKGSFTYMFLDEESER